MVHLRDLKQLKQPCTVVSLATSLYDAEVDVIVVLSLARSGNNLGSLNFYISGVH